MAKRGLLLLLIPGLLFSLPSFGGEYDGKILKYQKKIQQDPTDFDAAYQLGNYLAWDGRYDEAIGIYEEILKKEPGYEDAEIGIARVHGWKGDQDQAREKYIEILERNPRSYESYQGLGNLALWANDFEKAIDSFGKALAINPGDVVSLKGIGRAYLGRGDRRKAEEFFTKAQILEIKRGGWPLALAVVAGVLIPLALSFLWIRSRVRKRKSALLRMELEVLRYALAFHQHRSGKLPLALEDLLKERWVPPGTSEERPFLEGLRRGDRGFLVDPFGRKYWYNPDTGGIHSTMKGCEKW